MPELPEVEVCRRNLSRWSAGRRVVAVQVPDPGATRDVPSTRPSASSARARVAVEALAGRRAGPLARHGKRLAWSFGDRGLLLHLGMTGRWVRRAWPEVPRHGRVGLGFDDGQGVWLVDPRRFGCVVPLDAPALEAALHEGLGPDALDAPLGPAALASAVASRKAVKVALLDQDRVAGVGNIQAVEALFRARIHPAVPAREVPPEAWARLAEALPEQLRRAVAEFEAEEVAYVSDGGHVEHPFAVYGREGESCVVCGAEIQRAVMGGRSTFWCPSCQPAPPSA